MPFTAGQYLTANDLKSQEDAHTLGYGVLNGLKVVPTDPASMDIQVETGKAYVADTLVEKGAVTDLTVGAADPTNPRKDIVVCNSAGTLSIVAGTAEAALPSDKVGVYTLKPEPHSIPANSIILGEIWVPAGATEITGSEIYDKRVSIADFLTHKSNASAHHAKTTAGELNLADMAEKAHGSLTGVTAAQHHAKTTAASEITSGRFPVGRLPAMTDERIWKGTGGNVEEVDMPAAGGYDPATPGDTLLISANTERTGFDFSYTKRKEIRLGRNGAYRVKFDMRVESDIGVAYARVYKNGVAVGIEREDSVGNYTTYSEDFSGFVTGDLVQLYAHTVSEGGRQYFVRNFRIYVDKLPADAVITD